MEPYCNTKGTLVDLLDRVLDKGLVIHADLIVSVAGIPLIGVNLRAALAGMETMLKYGLMQGWDESTRTWEAVNRRKKENVVLRGEEVILKMSGGCFYSKGIYSNWRHGCFYLTGERLILCYNDFSEIIFETHLRDIRSVLIKNSSSDSENPGRELNLMLHDNQMERLHASDPKTLKASIEQIMEDKGLAFKPEMAAAGG